MSTRPFEPSASVHGEVARHVRVTLPAVPESVRETRRRVDSLMAGRCDETLRDAIVLAVSEASSNAVMHAYPDGSDGELTLFAVRVGSELIVSISDRGCGLSRPTATPGLGYGLSLIRSAAEQVTLREPPGGGSDVQMRFRLAAPAGDGEPHPTASAA